MNSDEDRKEPGKEEEQVPAPESGNRLVIALKRVRRAILSLLLRPKHFLQAGLVRSIDACSSLLQRLRQRAQESNGDDAPADEKHAEREPRQEKAPPREEPPKEPIPREAAVKPPRSRLHNAIIYLLVLVVGALAGMVFSFTLMSTMVVNQAQRIENQQDEISQLEKQNTKILESEARYRKENSEYRQRLDEFERIAEEAAKSQALLESAANSTAHAPGKPAQAKKTGKCNVDAGNIGGNLNRCIDDFNRK